MDEEKIFTDHKEDFSTTCKSPEIEVIPDPVLPARLTNGQLMLLTSQEADRFVIEPVANTSRIKVTRTVGGITISREYDGVSSIYGEGKGGNDDIRVLSGVNIPADLRGGSGNDYLMGGGANDKLYGDLGTDTLVGAGGNDYLSGGLDDDKLYGDDGIDTIDGDDGADEIHGGAEGDLIHGGLGNDTIWGDGGNDQLFGDASNDTLYGGDGKLAIVRTDSQLRNNPSLFIVSTNAAARALLGLADGRKGIVGFVGSYGLSKLLPPEGDFQAIIIDALDGNDRITVGPTVTKSVWTDAGRGEDLVQYKSGRPILIDSSEGSRRNDTPETAYNLDGPTLAGESGIQNEWRTPRSIQGLTIDSPSDVDC